MHTIHALYICNVMYSRHLKKCGKELLTGFNSFLLSSKFLFTLPLQYCINRIYLQKHVKSGWNLNFGLNEQILKNKTCDKRTCTETKYKITSLGIYDKLKNQSCGSGPGSIGSICLGASRIRIRHYLYGSGSWSFFFTLSLKTDENVPSKSNNKKMWKNVFFVGTLSATDEKKQDLDPYPDPNQ